MSSRDPRPYRMTGVRIAYESVPAPVREWVADELGSADVQVVPRVGGMSPAAAASLRTRAGRSAFVKAVGPEVNPLTPEHFRHEIAVLQALPPAPYRAGLLGSYDDGEWVAIMLEDIDGGHPDLDDLTVRPAVLAVVQEQSRELAGLPDPSTTTTMAEIARDALLGGLREASADKVDLLPPWFRDDYDAIVELVGDGVGAIVDDTYCNYDVRYDNLLLRSPTRQPVIVDWGQSRRGARWADTAIFAFEWVEQHAFDDMVATVRPTSDEQRAVTVFLAAFGARLTFASVEPAPPGLPRVQEFRRDLAARILEGARRRLGR